MDWTQTKRNTEMKTPLLVAMVIAGVAAASPSFAKEGSQEIGLNKTQRVLINREVGPRGSDSICQFPSDYRCPTANGGG
jgi:hypothetical protein